MGDVNHIMEVNMPLQTWIIILKKMPYQLRDTWITAACDFKEKLKQRAAFKDVVNFLERQVRSSKLQPQARIKGSIFASTLSKTEKEKKSLT